MKTEALALAQQLGLSVVFHEKLPYGFASVIGDVGFHPPVFHVENHVPGWRLLHEIAHWFVADDADRLKQDFGLDEMMFWVQEEHEALACKLTFGLILALGGTKEDALEADLVLTILDEIEDDPDHYLEEAREWAQEALDGIKNRTLPVTVAEV